MLTHQHALLCHALLFLSIAACSSPQQTTAKNVGGDRETIAMTADPLKSACDAGKPIACMRVGDAAQVAGQAAQTLSAYRAACELDHAPGCLIGGGYALETDQLEAGRALLEKGCGLGEPTACFGLGLSFDGTFGPLDHAAAISSHQKACALSLRTACGRVEILKYDKSKSDASLEAATAICKGDPDSRLLGDGSTCLSLAERFEGNDVKQVGFYEAGCVTDEPVGCYLAGVSIMKTDARKAADLFMRGCSATPSDPPSCAMFGWYEYQSSEDPDVRKNAVAKLTSACESQFAEACFRMAKVDAAQKEKWLSDACTFDAKRCTYFKENAQ